jgi:hypothetical protein
MYRKFKQRPQLGQRISVLLLSFVCLVGVGIGDFSYTKLLESGLGGGVRKNQESSFIRGAAKFLFGIDPQDLPGVLKKGLPYCVTKGKTAMVSSAVSNRVCKGDSPQCMIGNSC